MSMAFTAITNGSDIQSVSVFHELAQSHGERLYPKEPVPYPDYGGAVGDDLQSTEIWQLWQTTVEALAAPGDPLYYLKYINHTLPEDPITYFTLTTFRSVAGLHASGFRRAQDWPSDWTNPSDAAYGHGILQPGDIIGPWLFVDLQAAYSALRWSNSDYPPTTIGKWEFTYQNA